MESGTSAKNWESGPQLAPDKRQRVMLMHNQHLMGLDFSNLANSVVIGVVTILLLVIVRSGKKLKN